MPDKLIGLRVEQFAHPDDTATLKSLKKIKAVDKFFSFVEDQSNNLFLRMNTLGNYVRITEAGEPRIFNLVREVCDTLDYHTIPEIYSTRSYAIDVDSSGVDKPILVIPDFVLNNYDDALLRFTIGRAVTRLKSESLKFYVAAKVMIMAANNVEFLSESVRLAVANWMRKAELTADRGGLLACQNLKTSMAFLFNKAGMPIQEAKKVPYMDYIKAYKIDSSLAKIGKGAQTLFDTDGWANDRIIELFNWYASGQYGDLLEEFLD